MFTGIVQGKGEIVSIETGNEITTFRIRVPSTEGLQIGASISIDGVCLTATEFSDDIVSFDVIPETLEKTTLGQLEQGHQVNVERSLHTVMRLAGTFFQDTSLAEGSSVKQTQLATVLNIQSWHRQTFESTSSARDMLELMVFR